MFTVKIKTSNAAFDDGDALTEIARLLDFVRQRVSDGYTSGAVRDVNGNIVGRFDFVDTE